MDPSVSQSSTDASNADARLPEYPHLVHHPINPPVDMMNQHIWGAPYPPCINPMIYVNNQKMYRKGKWTEEEEAFTKALINAFNDGYLTIPAGTTLRSFLSDKLNW